MNDGVKKTECEWTRLTCKRLEELGCKVRAIVAGRRQAPGWPDRWVAHKLWHGHLEFKNVNTNVTTLQQIIIRDINARQPGTAFVVRKANDDPKDVSGVIEDHDGTKLYTFLDANQLLAGLHYLWRSHSK